MMMEETTMVALLVVAMELLCELLLVMKLLHRMLLLVLLLVAMELLCGLLLVMELLHRILLLVMELCELCIIAMKTNIVVVHGCNKKKEEKKEEGGCFRVGKAG
jgi:hypothetical protein